MKTLRSFVLRSVFIAATSVAIFGQTHAAVSCHKINAKGVGLDRGDGTTEAQIIGGGLLQGTTLGSFVVGGSPPALLITGTVTFTTQQATLTVTVAGTFNVATGTFVATGPVTAATGKLTGATGTLTLEGVEDLFTGKFAEDVSGIICVDLGP